METNKMTQQEIQANNILIAQFMGGFQQDSQLNETWFKQSHHSNIIVYSVYNNYPHKDLPFHRSWNYLIPVIHKLWETPTSFGQLYDKLDTSLENLITISIKHHMLYGSIEQCWCGVVNLIKYYGKKQC